jgi:hypothetical protein
MWLHKTYVLIYKKCSVIQASREGGIKLNTKAGQQQFHQSHGISSQESFRFKPTKLQAIAPFVAKQQAKQTGTAERRAELNG